MTIIHRRIDQPIREGLTWYQLWDAPDRGLIKCWEVGRQLSVSDPQLAARCCANELPPLGWKGGVSRTLKKAEKYGALNYLAQWQGLRGEDLCIDLETEMAVTCHKTGMIILFTPDVQKLTEQNKDTDDEEGDSNGRSASGIQKQPLLS